ncbi:AraC family transcriptional regulator ligand-binding domain-containing protein [Roseibium sp.]|uniref:AraC family transcriptional regulator ligand-binding domain-containing protein n=1 Tax=Roseibium sp. TaxID=1936156 RepID=UPI003A9780E6
MPFAYEHDWIIARPLILFAGAVTRRGIDFGPELTQLGVTKTDLGDPERRLPVRTVFAAYERLAEAISDDSATFDIFDHAPVGHGSLIDYVFLCAANLEEGLKNWERFWQVRSSCVQIGYDRANGFANVEIVVPDHFGPSSQFAFGFIALLCSRIEDIVSDTYPRFHVETSSKAPQQTSHFQEKLGSRLRFECERNRIRIPEQHLQLISSRADPSLFKIIEDAALAQLIDLRGRHSQASQIAATISQGLRTGNCSIDYVAGTLGMSPRGLQRNLEREGTNYRSVLDEVRRSIAQRYLVDTNRPINEIAQLLGFSDVSTFSRAVRNWFGIPPTGFRHRLQTAPGAGGLRHR